MNLSAIILVICLWCILAESVKRGVYKFIDKDGMAWEYEHKLEQIPGNARAEDIVVYNGPWTELPRSNSVHNLLPNIMGLMLSIVVVAPHVLN